MTTSGSTSAVCVVHSVGGFGRALGRLRVVLQYGTRRGFLGAVYYLYFNLDMSHSPRIGMHTPPKVAFSVLEGIDQ
jgi:hypothetical protein